jgi:hypothetical protein
MYRLVRLALQKFVRAGNLRITTARGTTYILGDGSGPAVALRFTTGAAETGVKDRSRNCTNPGIRGSAPHRYQPLIVKSLEN